MSGIGEMETAIIALVLLVLLSRYVSILLMAFTDGRNGSRDRTGPSVNRRHDCKPRV